MFDVEGAIQAGATEDQIIDYLKKSRSTGFDVQGARQAGASNSQIIDYLQQPKYEVPEERSFLGKTADVIGKTLDLTKSSVKIPGTNAELNPIRNFMDVVGTVMKPVGEGFGWFWSAGPGGQAANKILDINVPQEVEDRAAQQTIKATGEFAQGIGEEGAFGATLGIYGRVVNAAVLYGMGYAGYEDTKKGWDLYSRGNESGNPEMIDLGLEKLSTGLQSLALAGFGFKNTIKKGDQGILLNPKFKAQFKSEMNFIKTKGNEAEYGKNIETEAVKEYRNVLDPTKKEVKTAEIKKGGEIEDTIRTLVREGVILDAETSGNVKKLDTRRGIETIDLKREPLEAEYQKVLEKYPDYNYSWEQFKRSAKAEIAGRKNIIQADKEGLYAEIESLIDAERVKSIKQGLKGMTNAPKLNQAKRGFWQKVPWEQRQANPNRSLASYAVGKAISKALEKVDTRIKPMNQQLGKYADAIKMLEEAHGRPVRGSELRRTAARVVGISSLARVPVVGPLGGDWVANKVYDYAVDPTRRTRTWQHKLGNLQKAKELPSSIASKMFYRDAKGNLVLKIGNNIKLVTNVKDTISELAAATGDPFIEKLRDKGTPEQQAAYLKERGIEVTESGRPVIDEDVKNKKEEVTLNKEKKESKQEEKQTDIALAAAPIALSSLLTQFKQNQDDKKVKSYKINDKEKAKVIATVLAEAQAEGPEGIKAVMAVVNNRVGKKDVAGKKINKTPFDVVSEGNGAQFNGFSANNEIYKKYRDFLYGKDVKLSKLEQKNLEAALTAYNEAETGDLDDITNGSTQYYNPKAVKKIPTWDKDLIDVLMIGNHKFGKFKSKAKNPELEKRLEQALAKVQ